MDQIEMMTKDFLPEPLLVCTWSQEELDLTDKEWKTLMSLDDNGDLDWSCVDEAAQIMVETGLKIASEKGGK